jgi:hypothetical protein
LIKKESIVVVFALFGEKKMTKERNTREEEFEDTKGAIRESLYCSYFVPRNHLV